MCIDCTVWIALCTFLYKGMSLMYMLKRVGPRIDLSETPDRISLGVDEVLYYFDYFNWNVYFC